METIQFFLFRMMLLFVLIQLSACQKFVDKIFPGHNNVNAGCKIQNITGILSADGDDITEVIATVEYNDAGNPISLTYNREAAYLLFPRYMTYDSLNRLSGYKVYFREDDDNRPIEDHRYGYSGNTIVADTFAGGLTGYMKILATFEYDSKGRIILENRKIIEFEGSPDTWEQPDPVVYTYDSNDNRVMGDEYTYDDKVNFRRTSKVWMFIQRNYSRNNLVGATDYNERGLPTLFHNSKDYFFDVGLTAIDYDCH